MIVAILLYYYQIINAGDTSINTIKDFIVSEAIASNVNPQMALGIVERESKFNCNQIGDH
jgi:hypothetical protein